MRYMKRFLILTLMLLVSAVAVPVAFAGSPSDTQYPKAAVLVAKAKKPPAKPPTTVKSSGTLPFTGANLALVGGFGVLLVGGGFALRAAGRRRTGE
jgi:hypothetical protein